MLVAPAVFAATSITYPENGTDPVATFSATDQDGDAIVWSLSGRDEGDFTIDGGVLAFKSPPNYESPVSDATGTQAEKNVYKVTVKATGGSEDVTVTVTNVDEDGSASLSQYQPQVGRSLVASVSDPDSTPTSQEWQWARGATAEGTFTDIDGATNPSRSPTADDSGMYLRASVTYTDMFGSGKTASVVSGRTVEDTTLANARPSFEGQDQTGPSGVDGDANDDDTASGFQDYIIVSRSVAENTAVGAPIGDPITATDGDGDVLIYELEWSPDLRTGAGTAANPSGDARFRIDKATGQLKVEKKLNFEAADGTPDKDEDSTTLTADTAGGARAATSVANDEMYVLRVKATDPSGAYSNVNVTVELTDANEAPTFAEATRDPRTAVTVVEDTTALLQPATGGGTEALAATTFVATDVDDDPANAGTPEAVVSYALEGADAGNFEIGNDATDTGTFGQLTIDTTGDDAHTPDYEEQDEYSITIVATSGVGDRRLAGRLDVTIKVTPAEDDGSVELSQIEPREGRPVVATLKDDDGNVNVSKWQWQYAPLGGETTCQTVTTGWTDVPKATSASYTPSDFVDPTTSATVDIANNCLRATATYTDDHETDNDTLNSDGTVTTGTPDGKDDGDTAMEETDAVVQVAGAVNSAPKFPDQDLTTPGDQSDETSRTVMENTKANTNIGSPVTANDGDLMLYTLGGSDAAMFGIDRKTGQIKTKADLDYEALPEGAKYHMVTVTATDPAGASDSISVTINVTDENDGAMITQVVGPTPEDPGDTCGMTEAGSSKAADCRTLLSIMDELVGDGTASLNWDEDTAITDWVGLAAGTDRVRGIYLPNSGLAGTLPAGIAGLDALERLTLTDNELTGEIPDLTGLDNIEVLVLGGNAFTGGIPASLGNLDSLLRLWLHRNDGGFEGGIPAELGNLSNLRYLMLYGNGLTGEIPAELGMATNLKALYLHNNMLTGSIPAELGNLTGSRPDDTIRLLYLHNNMLSGDIPAELGNLTSLTRILLRGNMLTGCVPAAIADAADLDRSGLMACAN